MGKTVGVRVPPFAPTPSRPFSLPASATSSGRPPPSAGCESVRPCGSARPGRPALRFANCAMSGSWVTRTIVSPSSFSSWRISRISTDVRLSRLPVGSSASRIGGPVHEGARDGHALLLPAGHLRREVLAPGRTARPGRALRQRASGARRSRSSRRASEARRSRARSCAGQEVEALEHEADLLVADQCQSPLVEPGDVDAVEQVPTELGPVEAAEDVHERRLAAPARAHDGHELAALDRDADPAERVHARFTQVVVLVDVLDADEQAGRRGPLASEFRPGSGDLRHHGTDDELVAFAAACR